MKNKKVLFLLPILIILTLVFSYFFSNRVKTQIQSQEEMYYDITHNPDFPRVDGAIFDMALNADGSILYVAGYFTQIGDIGGSGDIFPRNSLAAINTSDYSITSWNPQANDMAQASEMVKTIEVYGDSIYVGGVFNYIGETYTGEFAKINSNGTLDTSCMPNIHTVAPTSTIYDISITSGYIYIGGSFNRIGTNENEEEISGILRLINNSSCTWDDTWQPGVPVDQYSTLSTIYTIETDGDSVYIGGNFEGFLSETEVFTYTGGFAKINSEGTLDTNCVPDIHTLSNSSTVYDISTTTDYIYVGGSFNNVSDYPNEVSGLVRLERDSSCEWDSSWVPSIEGMVYSITPIGNDFLIGGKFDRTDSPEGKSVAIIDGETGDVLPPWNPEISWTSVSNDVEISSTLVHGNKIYIGGNFDTVANDYQSGGYSFAQFSYAVEQIPTIEIHTIEDLSDMKLNLIANYTLMNDLDFEDCSSYSDCSNMEYNTTEIGWEPVGFFDEEYETFHPYYGVFDGQGYEISNLHINRAESIGLFGVNNGTIKDVKLVDANVQQAQLPEGMQAPAGVIAAFNNGTITGCYTSGQVSGNEYVGGLVGVNYGPISNSSSSVSVTGTVNVGGLVGENYGPISNSYATGTVMADSFVGGLVGYNNTGDISVENNINNSYSTGLVTGTSYTGGLVGEDMEDNANLSYWDNQTSGINISAGGLGKTTSEMKTLSTYSGWDIIAMNSFNPSDPSIWYMSDEQDYPRLYWEYSSPEALTKPATNILGYSTTLNGELISMDGEIEVGVYFRYRHGEGEWTTTDTIIKTTTGVFSSSITGLTLNTQYQYQSVVTWRDVGTVYGNIVTFSTPETPPLPTTFGSIVSNIDDIQTPSNTEVPLVLTKIGIGSITFSIGLNLVGNYDQLTELDENLVIVFEPSNNRFRAFVDSDGASFLANHGAIIKFFNVKSQLGINGLTSSNFRTLLKIDVLNDSNNIVTDTSSYFNWNNSSYNEDTDILTMPVNHFSEYVLGVNTGELPSTGMSSLTLLIPIGMFLMGVGILLVSKKRYKMI